MSSAQPGGSSSTPWQVVYAGAFYPNNASSNGKGNGKCHGNWAQTGASNDVRSGGGLPN